MRDNRIQLVQAAITNSIGRLPNVVRTDLNTKRHTVLVQGPGAGDARNAVKALNLSRTRCKIKKDGSLKIKIK